MGSKGHCYYPHDAPLLLHEAFIAEHYCHQWENRDIRAVPVAEGGDPLCPCDAKSPFDCDLVQASPHDGVLQPQPYNISHTLPQPCASDKELRDFQSNLFWLGLSYSSTAGGALISTVIFFLFSVVVPILNDIYVRCSGCEEIRKHPFEKVVQLSESALAAIAYLNLLHMLRKHGLKEMLLLNDIGRDSEEIQQGYKQQIRSAFHLLVKIMLPCLVTELVHKIVWFVDASVEIPFFEDSLVKKTILCSAVLVAWFYRTSIFLFMCVLFRLMCLLQILRFQSLYKILRETPPVFIILQEHMYLRDQLFIISHRFRNFIVLSFFTITLSQFASLFQVTASNGAVSFERLADLVVCSAVQLIGFIFCLHGAAKITHKAQRIVSIVSQWHAIATCMDATALESTSSSVSSNSLAAIIGGVGCGSQPIIKADSHGDLATSLDIFGCTKDATGDFYSFQKRNALVTYLRHCSAGISIYGFFLDRGLLYTIFALELSIILWTLGKTIILIK